VAGFYVASGSSHGFFGTPGNLQSFDLSGALATAARGINNMGQLVGEYVDGSGARHAYVTAPISAAACFDH
jgi:probable HAF family extracellular repeat protein